MTLLSQPLDIRRGVVHVAGRPHLLMSADYPYYRDEAEVWPARLRALRAMGIHLVSAYIPWRHHQTDPATPPDFTGRTQANRDVLGFLRLCQELGLAVIAKPGPFIHGETNYGGLPDWTCPLHNPLIEPLRDAAGQPPLWSGGALNAAGTGAAAWPLPAPYAPEFQRLCAEWLERVGREVVRPLASPAGPIVAVQIANEGLYSNGQHAPEAYDYSASGVAAFRDYLSELYGTVAGYNQRHGTAYAAWAEIPAPTVWTAPARPSAALAYDDWGRFLPEHFGGAAQAWADALAAGLPVLINQNPPLRAPNGRDAWLTRAEPERWPALHYGFTNWVGDISADADAFDRYLLTPKRAPGVNLEENWGFAELYDPAYVDAATCFYQSLAILNAGATGLNIYTGVATGKADTNLEVVPKTPYPDAAPITAEGRPTGKAEIVRWLADFADCYGEEFLASRPHQPAAWGLYLPYARAGAWTVDGPSHGRHLEEFQRQMRSRRLDYGLLNLETASLEDCLAYPRLLMAGGAWLSRAVQAKLAAYVAGGGQLAIVGPLPELDETLAPLTAPWPRLRRMESVDLAGWLDDAAGPQVEAGAPDVWVRSHPDRDVHFVTVLFPVGVEPRARLRLRLGVRDHQLEVAAAASGGALLRVAAGRLTAALIKGHNGYRGSSVAPRCELDAHAIGADQPGDYAWLDTWTAFLPAGAEAGERRAA